MWTRVMWRWPSAAGSQYGFEKSANPILDMITIEMIWVFGMAKTDKTGVRVIAQKSNAFDV